MTSTRPKNVEKSSYYPEFSSKFLHGTFSVAITSLCFDLDLDENHTDTHKKTSNTFPFEAVIGRLSAVDVLEHYGNWTADMKWLIKQLVIGKVTQQNLFRKESVKQNV